MAGEQILVVDDNVANLRLVQYVLSARGYAVRTAMNADEALEAIASECPRLILMDIQLPDVDGLTLTVQLKADPATREIAVVAVTAYAMKGDAERARAAGCDDYVTKPIDVRTLPEVVARHLHRGSPGTP